MPHDHKESGARGGQRKAHNRKLTDDQVRAIRALVAENSLSKAAIGRQFGVSSDTVRGIATGFNYSKVQ